MHDRLVRLVSPFYVSSRSWKCASHDLDSRGKWSRKTFSSFIHSCLLSHNNCRVSAFSGLADGPPRPPNLEERLFYGTTFLANNHFSWQYYFAMNLRVSITGRICGEVHLCKSQCKLLRWFREANVMNHYEPTKRKASTILKLPFFLLNRRLAGQETSP